MVRSLSLLLLICSAATLGCASVAHDTRKDAAKTPQREPQNDVVAAAIASLLVPAAVAGLGVGILVDANHVYESDRNARLYNATGPTGARAVGATVTVLGALLTAATTVGVVAILKAPPPQRATIATNPPVAPPERRPPSKEASPPSGASAAAQVAIAPEDAASAEQATQAAREACRKACSATCGKSEACDSKCVEEACK
jgi:hypothetical protein